MGKVRGGGGGRRKAESRRSFRPTKVGRGMKKIGNRCSRGIVLQSTADKFPNQNNSINAKLARLLLHIEEAEREDLQGTKSIMELFEKRY